MAQQVIQLDQGKLSCSICLDFFKDPVTIPCGHSYCMSCINCCWDDENEKRRMQSCPQCRQSFTPRPVLVKNTVLAELAEELKKVQLQAASPVQSYAGPGDEACDFCAGVQLKAVKSCLVCMASYCEEHLQPHYNVARLKKHKLVEATLKLEESICPRHDEVMKIFCRTDKRSICYLCSMDDHKGHNTVSAAAERAERQSELGERQQKIQQRIQDRERVVTVLRQRVDTANASADKAVGDSEKIFTELTSLIAKSSSEVKQQIRSQQKTHASWAEGLEEKLQQEIAELRRKNTELEQLSHTEDHLHFLKVYHSLSHLREFEDLPSVDAHPLPSFEGVAVAVSEVRDELQAALSEGSAKISMVVTQVDVSPPQEPRTRTEFLKYSQQITLDSNTAHTQLSLRNGNRKVTLMSADQLYPAHPERFCEWWQVLSKEGLTGRCYWEVKWSGIVHIAVSYKNISRTGNRNESGFGFNEKSWSLECHRHGYTFRHNNINTPISRPQSSVIGVYLDHTAGTLSYYSISETMTLLHKVQTRFTQPLHCGLWLPNKTGGTAEVCEVR